MNPTSPVLEDADQKAYFELYDLTAKTIKSIDPAFEGWRPQHGRRCLDFEFLAHVTAKRSSCRFRDKPTHTASRADFSIEEGKGVPVLSDAIVGGCTPWCANRFLLAISRASAVFYRVGTIIRRGIQCQIRTLARPYILTKLKSQSGIAAMVMSY